MVDPKKLITGFLLLAVLMSSVLFIFSSFRSEKTEVSDLAISSGALKNEVETGSPLFENLPEAVGGVADKNPELPPVEDPSNLTDNLAQELTAKMATLDPSEGGLIENKALELSEEVSLFSSRVAAEDLSKELLAFDEEIKKIANDFKIKNNASTDDILAYQEKLGKILDENFSRFSAVSLTNEGSASSLMNSLELAVDLSLMKTRGMNVPEEMTTLHQSLLKFLAYQKEAFDMVADEEDPLKATLVLQLKEKDYDIAALNLESELLKFQKNQQELGLGGNNEQGFFGSILGVKKAHAFLFGMITFDPQNFWKDVKKWVKETLGEMLKKRLVNQMVNQTIKWIQGKGKPKFIQDFDGFILGEADRAVGNAIYKHYPELCSPISKSVKNAFYSTGVGVRTTPVERTRCTLSEIVNNIEEFYDNFGIGGWANYLEIIKPQNNAYGAIMILSDIALSEEGKATEAAKVSAQSAGGNLPTRKCKNIKPRSINSALAATIISEDELSNPSDASADAELVLRRYGELPVRSNGEEINYGDISGTSFLGCPSDGWNITTPGTAVGDVLGKALGGHLDWIVNTTDLKALATAFVDSMVNKLIKSGTEGILSATVNRKSPRQQTEELLKSCESFATSTPERQDCVDNANEIAKIFESVRISTSTLSETAYTYSGMFNDAINNDNKFLDLVGPFSQLVTFALTNCTSSQADFVAQRDAYIRYMAESQTSIIIVVREIAEASSSIKWLYDYTENKIPAAKTNEDVDILTQELDDKFAVEQVSYFTQGAKERFLELEARLRGTIKQVNNGGCTFPPGFQSSLPSWF